MWQRTSVHVLMDQKADTREYTSKDATLSNLLPLLIFQFLQFPEPPQILLAAKIAPFKTCVSNSNRITFPECAWHHS